MGLLLRNLGQKDSQTDVIRSFICSSSGTPCLARQVLVGQVTDSECCTWDRI